MPATMNASVTDGPDRSAIAAAVRTNKPAPMMAPIPSAISAIGPRVRFSVPSPLAEASTKRRSIDLVRNKEPATNSSQSAFLIRRPLPPVCSSMETRTLYARESLDIGPHARRRIAAGHQVADDGDRPRARRNHRQGVVQADAADRYHRSPTRRGVPNHFKAYRFVPGDFRRRAEH